MKVLPLSMSVALIASCLAYSPSGFAQSAPDSSRCLHLKESAIADSMNSKDESDIAQKLGFYVLDQLIFEAHQTQPSVSPNQQPATTQPSAGGPLCISVESCGQPPDQGACQGCRDDVPGSGIWPCTLERVNQQLQALCSGMNPGKICSPTPYTPGTMPHYGFVCGPNGTYHISFCVEPSVCNCREVTPTPTPPPTVSPTPTTPPATPTVKPGSGGSSKVGVGFVVVTD